MEEGPSEERPRWSFSWLMRIQRVGRNRAEHEADDRADRRDRVTRLIVTVILGAIALIEIGIAVWLGILPR